ncbi:MAG: SDR family NAD(P)-dependent oxidoreductase [Thiohalocapsa sp.]|uniref:SDR family NAD(P)-dependent oxidoreductase n=1 Tax=Thiohalocapsa sp. TaxID=2497641 RepID=UPI0025CE1458|nr:SDR family NAD(P)-dependent oxidoreductase [Thiohalocapsa sp.]MCG6942707.1 SDR family NAD(P)-dependent oxidoreductase [Thiohalocapsa sp.]
MHSDTAIVAGVGPGLGQALCRHLAEAGYRVAGLARRTTATPDLTAELGPDRFRTFSCDVTDAAQVDAAIRQVEAHWGPAGVYVHNAAPFHMSAFADTDPSTFESLWRTMCLGAVHGAQRVLPGMLERQRGFFLFIGATASVKAGATFSAFGSAKFALRGLARELGPQGIHVAHLVIDGVIWSERARDTLGLRRAQCLDPDVTV